LALSEDHLFGVNVDGALRNQALRRSPRKVGLVAAATQQSQDGHETRRDAHSHRKQIGSPGYYIGWDCSPLHSPLGREGKESVLSAQSFE
jgi:hypothetical protein